MAERTFTEEEINKALQAVAITMGQYSEKMSFHDIVLMENVLMKVESAIFDGVTL